MTRTLLCDEDPRDLYFINWTLPCDEDPPYDEDPLKLCFISTRVQKTGFMASLNVCLVSSAELQGFIIECINEGIVHMVLDRELLLNGKVANLMQMRDLLARDWKVELKYVMW